MIERYDNFDELTPTIINEFVEKILVHERDRKGSQTANQKVEIYFNFIGNYEPSKEELSEEEMQKLTEEEEKERVRKDRLHQNYLKRKANGKQKEYEERYKARREEKKQEKFKTLKKSGIPLSEYKRIEKIVLHRCFLSLTTIKYSDIIYSSFFYGGENMSAIDLIVLGMIKEKEQSAYDLQKNVEYRNISKWIKVSTPSIYKKVVQLEEKGYIKGNVSKEGNMPEKSIYHITEKGNKYFLELMKKISSQMVNIFLDFNAVIINLEMVSPLERKELTENIEYQIRQFQKAVLQLKEERTDIPFTGKTILKQQVLLSEALNKWIENFRELYLEE